MAHLQLNIAGGPFRDRILVMDIEQFMALIESAKNPGEDGIPETVYDDLSTGFSGVSENFGAANAKIQQLEDANALLLQANNDLKLKMFDELLATPAAAVEETETSNEEPAEKGISSLFEK